MACVHVVWIQLSYAESFVDLGKQFITLANNAYEKWETGVSFNWVKLLYCSIRASICKVVEEVSNSGGVYGSRVLIR